MAMSENSEINIGIILEIFFGKNNQRLVLFAFVFCIVGIKFFAVTFRPRKTEILPDSWRNKLKKPLEKRTVKYFSSKIIVARNFIAVRNEKSLTSKRHRLRLTMNSYADFIFEITESPNIVIARKKVNFNSRINQFSHFPQKTNITFGNNRLVFVPKIEHIAHHKNGFRIGFHRIEPRNKFVLVCTRIFFHSRTQMRIGYEIKLLHN